MIIIIIERKPADNIPQRKDRLSIHFFPPQQAFPCPDAYIIGTDDRRDHNPIFIIHSAANNQQKRNIDIIGTLWGITGGMMDSCLVERERWRRWTQIMLLLVTPQEIKWRSVEVSFNMFKDIVDESGRMTVWSSLIAEKRGADTKWLRRWRPRKSCLPSLWTPTCTRALYRWSMVYHRLLFSNEFSFLAHRLVVITHAIVKIRCKKETTESWQQSTRKGPNTYSCSRFPFLSFPSVVVHSSKIKVLGSEWLLLGVATTN